MTLLLSSIIACVFNIGLMLPVRNCYVNSHDNERQDIQFSPNLAAGELRQSNYLMVCKHVQETVHHIFNSWFWSAPVIKNLQNGTLVGRKNRSKKRAKARILVLMWGSCRYWLWILPLVVVAEKKTGERTPSVRPQLMETPIFQRTRPFNQEGGFSLSQAEGITMNQKKQTANNKNSHKAIIQNTLAYLGLSWPPSMYICQNLM